MASTVVGPTVDGVNGDLAAQTRRRLSRQDVVEQALALLEEGGPGALSMRRLADRLGVTPNALYSHVHDKADLVDALVEEVFAGIDLAVAPADHWTEQLAALAQSVRRHLLAHPAVIPLALQRPGLGPQGLRLGEAIYDILRPAGFSGEAVVCTVYSLLTYVVGSVAMEAPRAGDDPDSDDEYVRRLRAYFGALPPRSFPHHVELAPLLTRSSGDERFQFGLRTLVTGLVAECAGDRFVTTTTAKE